MTEILRVITYWEDGEWIAHLLEMDLVGCGESAEEAFEELKGAFEAQITFCLQHDMNPFRPAPDEVFEKWEKTQRNNLVEFVQPSHGRTVTGERSGVKFFQFTDQDRKRLNRASKFSKKEKDLAGF
ncbi:MAG: type II toxin-antitoxin system HicB family antitoxin [Verrucomicrobiales bacterium]